MTKNKLVAVFMGIKTVQHDHWAYGDVTAIVHQGIIDLPLLIYEPDKNYNHLHEAWRKFRDLKFNRHDIQNEHFLICVSILNKIGYNTITEAFDELVKGIEWYASIVYSNKA